jgi:hypothetical protein
MPLFLTEYASLARDGQHRDIAAGMEPCIADTSFTVSGSSGQSAVFSPQTSFVMIHAQEACCLAWGTNPTATTAKQRIAAGETRYVGIPAGAGFRVAAILGV